MAEPGDPSGPSEACAACPGLFIPFNKVLPGGRRRPEPPVLTAASLCSARRLSHFPAWLVFPIYLIKTDDGAAAAGRSGGVRFQAAAIGRSLEKSGHIVAHVPPPGERLQQRLPPRGLRSPTQASTRARALFLATPAGVPSRVALLGGHRWGKVEVLSVKTEPRTNGANRKGVARAPACAGTLCDVGGLSVPQAGGHAQHPATQPLRDLGRARLREGLAVASGGEPPATRSSRAPCSVLPASQRAHGAPAGGVVTLAETRHPLHGRE